MHNIFELLCRSGYAARGLVYVLLGGIALASAFRGTGKADSEGVFATILGQPFGRIVLGLVALGLIGHVLWRLVQGILNADGHEGDLKGWLARAGNLASAAINATLAYGAVRLALGSGSGGGGGEDTVAAWLMEQPLGRWLVAFLGIGIVAAGCVQAHRGLAQKYRHRLRLPPRRMGLLKAICGFGLAARGLVIATVGGFFIYAAFVVDPQQAGGMAEALDWVHRLPFGWFIYGMAALGFIAFGAYSFIAACYRHMAVPDPDDVKTGVVNVAP